VFESYSSVNNKFVVCKKHMERQSLGVKTMSLRGAVVTSNASALEDSIRQRGPPEA
jgi:hypothetical protein